MLNLEVYIHGFKQASVGLRGFQVTSPIGLELTAVGRRTMAKLTKVI